MHRIYLGDSMEIGRYICATFIMGYHYVLFVVQASTPFLEVYFSSFFGSMNSCKIEELPLSPVPQNDPSSMESEEHQRRYNCGEATQPVDEQEAYLNVERRQCSRHNGQRWRCSFDAAPCKTVCAKHLYMQRQRLKKSHSARTRTKHNGCRSNQNFLCMIPAMEDNTVDKNESDKDSKTKDSEIDPEANGSGRSESDSDFETDQADPGMDEIVEKSFDDLELELKKFENENDELNLKNKATRHMARKEIDKEMTAIFQQQKDLEERQAQLELEKQRLKEDKEKMLTKKERFESENEILEEHEEDYRKLIGKYKKETRELKIQLYKERKHLAEKHRLELEMHNMQSICDTGKQDETNTEILDWSVKGKEEELEEMLKEKSEELESLEQMNLKLISMQREVNDEIQKAREAAMQFFKDDTEGDICVKRMGELCDKAWKEACKKKFSTRNWEVKCVELFSLWQDHVRNSLWFPFKVETCGDKNVQVVDWKDEKLIELKESLGDEVCNSVIKALEELNEYNSSGRYPVSELWNVTENRKATLSEVIELALSSSKQRANKRRRP